MAKKKTRTVQVTRYYSTTDEFEIEVKKGDDDEAIEERARKLSAEKPRTFKDLLCDDVITEFVTEE